MDIARREGNRRGSRGPFGSSSRGVARKLVGASWAASRGA
jgi:hypothetical protein